MRIYSNFNSMAHAEWEYGEHNRDCDCDDCLEARGETREDQLEDECGEVDEEVAEPWGCHEQE